MHLSLSLSLSLSEMFIDSYGATKRANELIARAYNHLYHIRVTGLRFFTVYGPWGRPDMAPYEFTDRVVKEKPITVFGDLSMKRDYTFVSDIVHGIVLALDHEADEELFNVGNGQPVVLEDFIRVVESVVGKRAVKKMAPRNDAELQATYADTSHTRDVLGYKPHVSVKEGMKMFVDWYTWFNARSKEEKTQAKDFHLKLQVWRRSFC
jgi:UDP-glucuronate 4-epimerase